MKTQAELEEALGFLDPFVQRNKDQMNPALYLAMTYIVDTLKWSLGLPVPQDEFALDYHIQKMRELKSTLNN